MSSLDDLLNSALDELEIQEKETPAITKTTTTTTTTNTTITTGATPSTIKPTYNKPPPPPIGNDQNFNVDDMMDVFKKILGEDTLKTLNEGFDKEYNKDINNSNNNNDPLSGLGDEDKKNIDEFAEKLASMFGVSADTDLNNMDDLKPFLDGLSKAGSGLNNNNSNNNNNENDGVHIDNFESSISDTLKNLAENASNKNEGSGLDDLFGNLSKLMQDSNFNLDGEETGQINDLFEESISYMAENYPAWIEKNKDNYSSEDIDRFKKQSELFSMIVQKEGDDVIDEQLLSRMSELGNLPDSFCEEYLKKIENDMENDQQKEKENK